MIVDPTLIGRRCVCAQASQAFAGIIRSVYMGTVTTPRGTQRPAVHFLVERDRAQDKEPIGSLWTTAASDVALEEPCPGCGKPMEHYGPRVPVDGRELCGAFCVGGTDPAPREATT